jgi:hypothetical protein
VRLPVLLPLGFYFGKRVLCHVWRSPQNKGGLGSVMWRFRRIFTRRSRLTALEILLNDIIDGELFQYAKAIGRGKFWLNRAGL